MGGGVTYLLNPGKFNFRETDVPTLTECNKYIAAGIHKSIRYVEGPAGRGQKKVGMIVESKKVCDQLYFFYY